MSERIVPIPPDVWQRMGWRQQQKARERAAQYERVQAALHGDVAAHARAIHAALPPEDPDEQARRLADAVRAIYGGAP